MSAALGCMGPSLHPVTMPVPGGTELRVTAPTGTLRITGAGADSATATVCAATTVYGRAVRQAGDTLWLDPLRQVDAYTPASPIGCVHHRVARVVIPRDSATVERVEEAGPVKQVVGSAIIMGAVAGTGLLLYNAIDGLIDLLDRWL